MTACHTRRSRAATVTGPPAIRRPIFRSLSCSLFASRFRGSLFVGCHRRRASFASLSVQLARDSHLPFYHHTRDLRRIPVSSRGFASSKRVVRPACRRQQCPWTMWCRNSAPVDRAALEALEWREASGRPSLQLAVYRESRHVHHCGASEPSENGTPRRGAIS